MQKDLKELINNWSVLIFTILWSLLLSSTYFIHNKFLSKSLQVLHFTSGIVMLSIALLVFIFLVADKKNSSFKKILINKLSGWKLGVLSFLFIILYFILYSNDIKAFEDVTNSYLANFSFNLIYYFFFLFSFFFSAFILGRAIIDKVNTAIDSEGSKTLISLAFGTVIFGIVFFFFGFFKIFTNYMVVISILLPLLLFYKKSIHYLKQLFIVNYENFEIQPIAVLAIFIFLFYSAANITNSFRPFPIGFDELSVYMDTPKLIANSHALLNGGQAANWSIIMAVGYLFNQDVILATLFSIIPGIFIYAFIYRIAKYVANTSISFLVASCFYVMPTFLWQSSADAKVDMALCFIICSIFLLLIASTKKLQESINVPIAKFYTTPWFFTAILLGIFAAFAFGIKYTALFFILAILVTIVFIYAQSFSLTISTLFAAIAILFISRAYQFSGIVFRDAKEPKLLIVIALILSIASFIFYVIKHKLKNSLVIFYIIVFLSSLFLTFTPWLIKNYSETNKFTISSLLNGDSKQIPLIEQIKKVNPLSSEIYKESATLITQNNTNKTPVDIENKYAEKNATGAYEEILRYIGYENGFIKYASLFYDMCTFKNVNTLPTDLGLVCFIFLPLLFISAKKEYLIQNFMNIGMLVFFLLLSIYSIFMVPSTVNLTSYLDKLSKANPDMGSISKNCYLFLQPIILTITSIAKPLLVEFTKQNTYQSFILILITIILLALINLKQIKEWTKLQQVLLFFTASCFIFWWMLGNAISWYGIAIFGLALVLFFSLHINDNNSNNRYRKYVFLSIIVCFLSVSIFHRSSSMITTYEYDSKLNKIFLQYAGNSIDEPSALQEVNKSIAASRDELNENSAKKILRIGTYMNYFIDKNNERVFEDNQLDNFTFVYNRYYGAKDVINAAFKKIGVEYILFDLNTGSIDKTPDKSLTNKVQKFYDYLSNNNGITIVTTDRIVEDPYSKNFMMVQGVKTPVSYSIFGTRVLTPGSIILLKIK